jgi:Cof subfamily protein (haloacid dehalogenase superfamily)
VNVSAVFLDVDGTLVDERGVVPGSARAAVQRARRNGHLVFLCTGRSVSQLWPEILDIGFDGVVAAAGGYVEIGGEVLANHGVAAEEVRHVTEFFTQRGVDFLLESHDGLFGSPQVQDRLRHLFYAGVPDEDVRKQMQRGLASFIDLIRVDEIPESARVNKVLFLDSPVSLDEIRTEFAGTFDVVPASVPGFGDNSGELTQVGVHKATGVQAIISHLGIARARTLAIGDGYNDLELLAQVGWGIAMGNAPPAVKAVADEVTATPDQDGVHAALQRHGLL